VDQRPVGNEKVQKYKEPLRNGLRSKISILDQSAVSIGMSLAIANDN
jgi:hypothetical protein